MDTINGVRIRLWQVRPKVFFDEAVLDADGTIAPTLGDCKEGMDMSHEGLWGHACEVFVCHLQPRKTAWGVQMFLQKLARRARRTHRRIVFWLPRNSPELNLIERRWKYLKASRMANVLFASFRAFTRHIGTVLTDFAVHPDFVLSLTTSTSTRRNILVAS